jgi:glycosyltransferase involved in cell wall biosynthesis
VAQPTTDNTANPVCHYAKNEVVRLLENPDNRGKGHSVRHAVLNAQGTIILFTDADFCSL